MYSVGEIKKITGISARTLQYYDEISLLKPSSQTNAKYRLYDDEALEKLQQIMFFKELGFKLAEIKQIMSEPDFDKIQAYKKQKELLLLKRNRTDRLIHLLEQLEKGEQCMSFKEFDLTEYISALEDFKGKHEADIVKYWGSLENYDAFVDKIKTDEEQVAKLAIKQFGSVEKYTEEMKKNLTNFSAIMNEKITPEVEMVGKKRDILFQQLFLDLSVDYQSVQAQNIIGEIIELISDNGGPDLVTNIAQSLIDTYSSEYVRTITDKQYGVGAADYIVKALQFYNECWD